MKITKKYLEKIIREEAINTLASIRLSNSERYPIVESVYETQDRDAFLAIANDIIKSKGLSLEDAKRMSNVLPSRRQWRSSTIFKARRAIRHLYGIIQAYLQAKEPHALVGKLAIDTVPAEPAQSRKWYRGPKEPKEAFQVSDMGLRPGFRLDIDGKPGLDPNGQRSKMIIMLYEVAKEIEAAAKKMGPTQPSVDKVPDMPPAGFFR